MKRIITCLAAAAGLCLPAFAAENYSVFRICEDQHVIRTSDGAEVGHIAYIVVDPSQQRIIATVVTGGVIGTKHISVPSSAILVGGEREIVLTNITRERIVSAPVIEVEKFRSSTVIEPAVFERSHTYFSANPATGSPDATRTTTTISETRDPSRSGETRGGSQPPGAASVTESTRPPAPGNAAGESAPRDPSRPNATANGENSPSRDATRPNAAVNSEPAGTEPAPRNANRKNRASTDAANPADSRNSNRPNGSPGVATDPASPSTNAPKSAGSSAADPSSTQPESSAPPARGSTKRGSDARTGRTSNNPDAQPSANGRAGSASADPETPGRTTQKEQGNVDRPKVEKESTNADRLKGKGARTVEKSAAEAEKAGAKVIKKGESADSNEKPRGSGAAGQKTDKEKSEKTDKEKTDKEKKGSDQ